MDSDVPNIAAVIAASRFSIVHPKPRGSRTDSTSEGVPNQIGIEAGTGSSGLSWIGLIPVERNA